MSPFQTDGSEARTYPAVRLSSFYCFYYAVLGAFTPYWSLYLESRGLGVAAISVLMSLWYATRIVSPSLWATIAARSAHPIRWLHAGCALALGCFALFLLPLEHAGLFAVMLGFCFAYNAVMPQFESITMSHLGARSDRYGLIRVWGSIGFIVVVASFGWLIDERRLGVGALPWLMLPVLAGVLGSALLNRYAHDPGPQATNADDSFRTRLRQPQVIAFFVAAFLTQVSFGPFYTFFSIYLSEHGYPTAAQGVLWTVGVLAEIGVFFLSSRIFRRWDASRVLMVALLSASLRWLVTALFPDNTPLMVVAQLTHALNFGAFFAAAMQLLVRFFPGRMNGHGQGVFYGLSSGVGGVCGALLAGQLWRIGGEAAFFCSSAIALVAAFIVWRWLVRVPTPA